MLLRSAFSIFPSASSLFFLMQLMLVNYVFIINLKKQLMKFSSAPLMLAALLSLLTACKKSNDNNNSGGGGSGGGGGGGSTSFNITGTSPEYVFWGDEVTINGTGFSTDKSQYSLSYGSGSNSSCPGGNDFQVISASATQLKVKLPLGKYTSSHRKCGPAYDVIIVTMNGKKDTTDLVKHIGWPNIGGVCTHFGQWAGDYLIPGDSTALNVSGATGIYAGVNNSNTNASLTVDGKNIPIGWRNYSICTFGLGGTITLDAEVFGELKCAGDPDWNNGQRKLLFKLFNPGTERFDTASYFVHWLPRMTYGGAAGPATVSISAGGFPQWTINGRYMYYQKARFVPVNCTGTPQEVAINHNGKFYNSGTFPIPLSVLSADCSYQIFLVTHCGTLRLIGDIKINP